MLEISFHRERHNLLTFWLRKKAFESVIYESSMDLNIGKPSQSRSDSSYEHSYLDKYYGKCSKTSNTFLFLFSNEMLFFND